MPANGINKVETVDFYDLKIIVENILSNSSKLKFVPCQDYAVLHSGRCAKIYSFGLELGIIGQLHPKLCQELELNSGPYVFEIDLDVLKTLTCEFELKDVNKFPRVARDLAFVVQNEVNVGDMIRVIQDEAETANLVDASVFDVYHKADEPSIKSVAINLIFQANRTLTEDEIKKDLENITQTVCTKFAANIRA